MNDKSWKNWRKPLEELRPHPSTSDEAPVSYRAGQIRDLFKEIERLQKDNTDLSWKLSYANDEISYLESLDRGWR